LDFWQKTPRKTPHRVKNTTYPFISEVLDISNNVIQQEIGDLQLSVSGETAESESGSRVCITYKHVKNWAQEARTDRRAAKTNKL